MRLRAVSASISLSLLLMLAGTVAAADADQRHPRLGISPPDVLQPAFSWEARTYAARCRDDDLVLEVEGAKRWKTRVAAAGFRGGSYRSRVERTAGQAVWGRG